MMHDDNDNTNPTGSCASLLSYLDPKQLGVENERFSFRTAVSGRTWWCNDNKNGIW